MSITPYISGEVPYYAFHPSVSVNQQWKKKHRKMAPIKQRLGKTRLDPGSGGTKFKHSKPKPINSRPKGISKKFETKVKKALEINDCWGKYVYISRTQLRQDNRDYYGIIDTDENGSKLEFGTVLQHLDATSILFNNKTPRIDWTTSSGNIDSDYKINLVNSFATMFFKSTSSHVVNIELYECSPKINTSTTPMTHINQSYNNFEQSFSNNTGGNGALDATKLGSSASDWVELYNHYKVKKHNVKLLPGQTTSLKFNGPKNRTLDLTKCKLNDALVNFSPHAGGKMFYARILNDMTVSSVSGKIFHWPSNEQGGVAMEFKRTYIMRPPPGETTNNLQKNIIKVGLWDRPIALNLDQQISVNNPVVDANTD